MKTYIAIILVVFLLGCKPEVIGCTLEAKLCPDGSSVGRIGPNCEFAQCPAEPEQSGICTQDAMECPDGSFVSRIGPDCNFAPCSTEIDEGCRLMQNEDEKVFCIGCAGGICSDPAPGWEPYERAEIGIPYNCVPTPTGCELVQ